jgi:hypothetical protein
MLKQFRKLVAGFQKAVTTRSTSPAGRKARLGIESLEDRSLMSVSPVASLSLAVQPSNTAIVIQPIRPPIFITMANLRNDAFNMTSLTNGTTHQLLIQTQTNTPYGTASFTGIWDGNKGGPGSPASGTLTYDASGNIHITFTFGNHSFAGTITGTPGAYHIDGEVTVPGGGGPGHVVGDQIRQMDNLVNTQFNMTSLDNGTTHQLLIQTETTSPYGTATFTGLWDNGKGGPGAPVTGTLSRNADGSIHIHFTWGNGTHTFDGTITVEYVGFTVLWHYHIDGEVTVQGGGGPGHVVGDAPVVVPVLNA